MLNLLNKRINKGIYNKPDNEDIPRESSYSSLGFISTLRGFELCRGKLLVGNLSLGSGKIYAETFGYDVNGIGTHFRQTATKVQYLDSADDTWKDSITGLTGDAGSFTPVSSLSGNFIFFFSRDGIWKIPVSNPASAVNMYDALKNYKGRAIYENGRHYLWWRESDPTGVYLSYVDSALYTTVTGEALADVASGTLAFKAGGATRTCFAVSITDTSSGEVFTDQRDGTLTGSLGSTGTINYATGAFTISGQSGAGTATYQWENSNNKGVTDFTYDATRLAGQGDSFRQDQGGDAIQNIHPLEGSYFSFKKHRVYQLTLTSDDLSGTNKIYREGIGIPTHKASTPTSQGIIFLNTFNSETPTLEILQRNPIGDNFETIDLTPQFDYTGYVFDDCVMDSWGEYVIFTAKYAGANSNNRIFLYNTKLKSIDIVPYFASTFAKDSGSLFMGDSLSENVYKLFTGYDDEESIITAEFIGNTESYDSQKLKKLRRIRFQGYISLTQSYKVYISYDNDDYQYIGEITGRGSYVDLSNSQLVGSDMVGSVEIGGDGDQIETYYYMRQMVVNSPKFRTRTIKIIPEGIGYVSVHQIEDHDILTYDDKLPTKYR